MIFKGYISSRKLLDGSINHQKVQNLVIRDACEKRGFEYKLSLTEYGIKNCFLSFNQMLIDIKKNKFEGIAFYSLAQLPENKIEREKLYKIVKINKKKILFSLENILVQNISDIKKIENLFKIKILLKFCPKKIKNK
jgi:sporadic carbohydrate cluster protein (TIGR04323 family)